MSFYRFKDVYSAGYICREVVKAKDGNEADFRDFMAWATSYIAKDENRFIRAMTTRIVFDSPVADNKRLATLLMLRYRNGYRDPNRFK